MPLLVRAGDLVADVALERCAREHADRMPTAHEFSSHLAAAAEDIGVSIPDRTVSLLTTVCCQKHSDAVNIHSVLLSSAFRDHLDDAATIVPNGWLANRLELQAKQQAAAQRLEHMRSAGPASLPTEVLASEELLRRARTPSTTTSKAA